MEYAPTSHNRTVYVASAVAGLASVRLGRYALTPHYTHIFVRRNATHCFIGWQKRRKQPEVKRNFFAPNFSPEIIDNYGFSIFYKKM
jgi:hypothetical protein